MLSGDEHEKSFITSGPGLRRRQNEQTKINCNVYVALRASIKERGLRGISDQ